MGADGYAKTGRIMEGETPYILLCPQCYDTLECTDDDRCYCFGCGVVWERDQVTHKCRFIGDEGIVEANPVCVLGLDDGDETNED